MPFSNVSALILVYNVLITKKGWQILLKYRLSTSFKRLTYEDVSILISYVHLYDEDSQSGTLASKNHRTH